MSRHCLLAKRISASPSVQRTSNNNNNDNRDRGRIAQRPTTGCYSIRARVLELSTWVYGLLTKAFRQPFRQLLVHAVGVAEDALCDPQDNNSSDTRNNENDDGDLW
ncbi:Ferric iron ABC transporter, permease protein [Anopheles sinensis]|uniref:Ferric iron ABC transporter, permease protein n=1 Tax=Anopheles sinensis TaxID=74873 RepID=A0A084W1M4_ANOSI|nr:Ferric iron ABC transporter, permease protein [Anopheles sinensis]